MKRIIMAFSAAVITASVLMPSVAAADVANGAKVFRKCKACHSLEIGKRRLGPSLAGVFGRKAGSVEGFKYSKAMVALDVVWDDVSMAEFLKAPRKYLKGTKMSFAGLRKPEQVTDLLAYLKANGG